MATPRRRRIKRCVSIPAPLGGVKVRPALSKKLMVHGEAILKHAEEVYALVDGLDTAVRDSVSRGLANIVEAAYDTIGCARGLPTDEWIQFVEKSTADWFRQKGFAEWFCEGAAVLFRCDPPRRLVQMDEFFQKTRRPKTRKNKVA